MRAAVIGLPILASVLALLSCEAPQPDGHALSDADIAALQLATKEYRDAESVNDWAAVTRLYTQSAIRLLPKGPTIQGRDAILAEFESRPSRIIEYDQRVVEIEGLGDDALVQGVFSYVAYLRGDTLKGSGKYMALYKRQADGSWLIDKDIFNFDGPSSAGPMPAN